MAVQPAHLPSDLGVIPVAPRFRRPRRVGQDAHVSRLSAEAVLRPPTGPVRAIPRPWTSVDGRVRARVRPSAIVLATLIVSTMLGLVYMTQVLGSQNARYAVDRLLVERDALMRTLVSQEATIAQWGSEASVVRWAQREGLDPLGPVKRVEAR